MLLATIAVIGPGITRAVALLAGHGIRDSHIAVMSVLMLVALLHDWRTRGRPHWVLLSGALLLITSQLTRRLVGGSEIWAQIGNWLIY
jgi:ABC-type xylose transport system permease subunit